MSRLVRLVGAAVAGVGLTLAFPPYDLWWVAVVATGAFALLLYRASVGDGALVGLVFGLAFFAPLLHWTGIYVGPTPWLILAVYQALYVVPLGIGVALVTRLPGWPMWTACLWVAQEALRDRWPFDGFTWGRLAFSQADGPTVGLASLGGAPLVTFAVAFGGGLLAAGLVAVATRQVLRAGLALAAAAGVLVAGTVATVAPPADGPAVTVALIQGNVPRLGLDFNAEREAVLRNHVDATLALAERVQAGTERAPDLVIWPENSSDIDPYRNPSAAALIDSAAQAIGVPILVGAVVVTDDGERLQNMGIVWDPVTGPGDVYSKRHPVPFAEYIPLRSIARRISDKVDLVRRDFQAGDEVGVLQVGPALVGDVICFEIAYDDIVRDTVRAGAQFIAVQTNNATFGTTPQTEQQLAMARLRAVEHGRTVLVVSTSGVSAVIGPDGLVQQRAEIFTEAALVTRFAPVDGQTPAARVGAAPEWVLTGVGLAAVVVAVVRGRRRPADGTGVDRPEVVVEGAR